MPRNQPFCNNRPDFADSQTAIFVGVVKSVYPEGSRQDYRNALTPLLTRWNPFTSAAEDYRDGLLCMWRGVLSPEEEQRLRNAGSLEELQKPLKGIFGNLPRRIQFTVTEHFSGPSTANFELFTGSGGGDCGVLFQPGESYLVVVHRDPDTKRWSTSICSGTQSARYAEKDLSALRDWKRGTTPVRSAFGSVKDWTSRVRVGGLKSNHSPTFASA